MNTRLCWLGLAIILVAAAILRLHAISASSLWFDEAISWHQASQAFSTMIRLTAMEKQPPLHNLILYVVIGAFGDSETSLRLPSAILGVATVAAIFWVGTLIGGRATGFLSAALLCLSVFHIQYSQDARPYALLALTSTLFAGATIRALETNRRGWHAASSIAALLLLYSHAYGALLWISVAIAVIASAKVWREPSPQVVLRWAIGQAIALLLFLPWAGILAWHYKQIVTGGLWIPKPSPRYMLGLLASVASGKFMALALFAGAALALAPPSLWLRLGLGSDAGIGGSAERHDARQAHMIRAVLLAWLFGPLFLSLTASLISQPILSGRYVIGSLPAWLVLASMGFLRLYRSKRIPALVLAIILAGILIPATATLWVGPPRWNEDTRSVISAYLAQAQPGDCVFASNNDVGFQMRFYLRNPPACYVSSNMSVDIAPWAFSAQHDWLFLRDDNPAFRRKLDDSLQAHGWRARSVTSDPRFQLFALEPAK